MKRNKGKGKTPRRTDIAEIGRNVLHPYGESVNQELWS